VSTEVVLDVPENVILLDVRGACAALGISNSTLFRLLQRGEITSCHVGRKLLFPRRELEEYAQRLVAAEVDRRPYLRGIAKRQAELATV
jgi:excisionase family DNA binding protein